MRWIRLLTAMFAFGLLAGCSEPGYPRDPEGTLLRATDGELVVGVSTHPPHVDVSDEGEVSGPEADIVNGYAESIGAEVVWVEGAESELMEKLKLGELDIVVGGLSSDSPWATHAALTRPYGKTTGPDGKEAKLVLATRLGENALLSNLERHLIDEGLEA
ncbi:MAG TPA: ABC transporter substrate-binding protein [Propionibacterium sp.]|nr:ABC transporter substrate-binding protein [Propionibacterium sp.]